jgi:hypothetical protein
MVITNAWTKYDSIDEIEDYLRQLKSADHTRIVRLFTDDYGTYHVTVCTTFMPGGIKRMITKNKLKITTCRVSKFHSDYVRLEFTIRHINSGEANQNII